MKPLFCAFISLLIIGSAFAESKELVTAAKCKEGERFIECGTCEPTCEDESPMCTMQCRDPMCTCEVGKVRSPEGKCVLPSECKPYNSTDRPRPQILPIPPSMQTPTPVCKENEGIKQCSGCEPSCDTPAPFCTKICRPLNICECLPNFYRHNETGRCVPAERCPEGSAARTREPRSNNTDCGTNEILKQCSGCENQCGRPAIMCKMMCNNIPKCECDQGFFRNNETGQCVPEAECPSSNDKKCGKNEYLKSCPGCEPTCDNQNPICPMICRLGEECQCKPGFVRNDKGKCVKPKKCPKKSCGENETLKSCPGCEPSCANPTPMCIEICRVGKKCECSEGFVRSDAGKCVRQSECSASGNSTGGGDDEYNPCAATSCPVGSRCEKYQPECFAPPCPPQGRCVGPETRPTRSTDDGVPTNPCAAMLCAPNTRCELQQVQCIRAPCPPIAQCVPINGNPRPTRDVPVLNGCENIFCTADSTCQNGKCVPLEGNRPPRSDDDLQISDPCATMRCAPDTRCERIQVNCIRAPCPASGRCVPINETEPPRLTCASFDCMPGWFCEEALCVKAPCPTRPRCVKINDTETVPNDRCMTVRCNAETHCVNGRCVPNDPRPTRSTDDLLASDPCATMRCRDGMVCSKILVNCLRTSGGCRPRGVCVPANANGQPSVRPSRSPDNNGNDDLCAVTECATGKICQVQLPKCAAGATDCGPRAVCLDPPSTNDLCAVTDCQSGKICQVQMPKCVAGATDCGPRAVCIDPPQNPNEDLCALVDCRSGMVCNVIMPDCIAGATDCGPRAVCTDPSPTPAVLPPAKDDPMEDIQNEFCMRARCAGPCITTGIKCNEDGSHCEYLGTCAPKDNNITGLDVCANSTCPTGKVCEAEVVQCFAPPCPPIPRCVEPSSSTSEVCATHKCPEGQECREHRIRCNRIIKNCKPLPMCVNKKQ